MTANDGLLAHWTHKEEEQMEVRKLLLSISPCVTRPMQKKNKNNKKKESDTQLEKTSLKLSFFLHFYVFPLTFLLLYFHLIFSLFVPIFNINLQLQQIS